MLQKNERYLLSVGNKACDLGKLSYLVVQMLATGTSVFGVFKEKVHDVGFSV